MFLNKEIFLPLYKALVRSHFDYAMSIWNPHMIKFIESIESVQRRATKLIPKIKNLTYSKRLKALNLPTLSYQRFRGDMIEVYKIISNIYDSNTSQTILNFREKNSINLTLSDPGYFRQLTIRGGGFKSPPHMISKTIVSIFTISYMYILSGVLGMFQLEFLKNLRF